MKLGLLVPERLSGVLTPVRDELEQLVASIQAAIIPTTPGQIVFPAAQSSSSNINTLDDYKERSWAPVLTFVTPGNLSVVYSTQTGVSTKVGNLVFYSFHVITTTFTHTTASGSLLVTGLPFTSNGTPGLFHIGAVQFGTFTLTASYTQITARIVPSVTQFDFVQSGSTVGPLVMTTAEAVTGSAMNIAATGCYVV